MWVNVIFGSNKKHGFEKPVPDAKKKIKNTSSVPIFSAFSINQVRFLNHAICFIALGNKIQVLEDVFNSN